jgi:hypothetical protein
VACLLCGGAAPSRAQSPEETIPALVISVDADPTRGAQREVTRTELDVQQGVEFVHTGPNKETFRLRLDGNTLHENERMSHGSSKGDRTLSPHVLSGERFHTIHRFPTDGVAWMPVKTECLTLLWLRPPPHAGIAEVFARLTERVWEATRAGRRTTELDETVTLLAFFEVPGTRELAEAYFATPAAWQSTDAGIALLLLEDPSAPSLLKPGDVGGPVGLALIESRVPEVCSFAIESYPLTFPVNAFGPPAAASPQSWMHAHIEQERARELLQATHGLNEAGLTPAAQATLAKARDTLSAQEQRETVRQLFLPAVIAGGVLALVIAVLLIKLSRRLHGSTEGPPPAPSADQAPPTTE